MSYTNCTVCKKYIYDPPNPTYMTCDECLKQCQKLGEDTYDWLMRLIENRIEWAINEHTIHYNHERNTVYY